jgi:outer membrane protein TolC
MSEPIAISRTLADLPDPILPDAEQAVADSLAGSPELKRARLTGEQADRRVDLARKERWPDVTVSAGVMPRGGNFDTMWQAGISFNIPVWSMEKQSRAIAENQSRGQAARSGAEAIRQRIEQRVRERLQALHALVESNRLYRSGLLVQSEATVASTLVQYQVGRVPFASVLEALSGYLVDVNGFLESIAAAQRIAIAEREVSLETASAASANPPESGM